MSKIIPCLFEVDSNSQEATGVVKPFCSISCLENHPTDRTDIKWVKGISKSSDFGYIPRCDTCGKAVTLID